MNFKGSFLIFALSASLIACNLVIENSEKTMKLQTHITESKIHISIRNNGQTSVTSMNWNVCNCANKYLIFLNAEGLYDKYNELKLQKVGTENNNTVYKIEFNEPLKPNQKLSLKITENYFGKMKPLPKKITISEDQNVVIYDNALLDSQYEVLKHKSIYQFPSVPMFSTEIPDKTSKQISTVTYGQFQDVKPNSKILVKHHFENNKPLVVFKEVKQLVEVSHWGNIKIQTEFKLANEGAELTGEYNRVDYNPYKPNAGKNALKSLSAELPFHASGVYYRDEVGNISTSNAYRRHDDKDVKLEIRNRFSIFGGWKSNWFYRFNSGK